MDSEVDDPIVPIAGHVADCLSASGYAFVEDDQIGDLAEALKDFLDGAGIAVNLTGLPAGGR